MEYSRLKSLTNALTFFGPSNWALAPAPFSSLQYNSWWSEWKLHLRSHPVALYCAKNNTNYNPTVNEVTLTFILVNPFFSYAFVHLFDQFIFILHVADRNVSSENKC